MSDDSILKLEHNFNYTSDSRDFGGVDFAAVKLPEDGVVELEFEALGRGVLAAAFGRGAAAAVIRCGDRLRAIWRRLLEEGGEVLPWESALLDLARNHHGGPDIAAGVGDVYYFQPGRHGYIARKIEARRAGGRLELHPETFVQGGERFEPDREAIARGCEIVDAIVAAMTPPDARAPDYAVAVQRIKYQSEAGDYERLARLTRDSLGRWGRWGFAVDAERGGAAGRLGDRLVGGVRGLLARWPSGRDLSTRLARWERPARDASGLTVVEGAHVDSRLFTALCGKRSHVRTEILHDGAWRELKVGLDAIAVFPGAPARRLIGAPPTVHRVLHRSGEPGAVSTRSDNVTLLLGAVV